MTAVREGMVSGAATADRSSRRTMRPRAWPGPVSTGCACSCWGWSAGLCAAIELRAARQSRCSSSIDKPAPGGKLTLQTHQFFGSSPSAGRARGALDIATILADELARLPSVKLWMNSTAVGVFNDGRIGVVSPGRLSPSLGGCRGAARGARRAREEPLVPGCDLPGSTARAPSRPGQPGPGRRARKLFVLGGGNVGLIGAYHALQAGIDVVGLVEALPEVGGYKVHADKIRRLGVPVWTSHTVVRAEPGPTASVSAGHDRGRGQDLQARPGTSAASRSTRC